MKNPYTSNFIEKF